MSLRLKPDAKARVLSPQCLLAMVVAEGIWRDADFGDCTITSISDGQHSRKSKHWLGNAFDVRTRELPEAASIDGVAYLLRQALPEDYDVVVESDHIHVEYDPKGKG